MKYLLKYHSWLGSFVMIFIFVFASSVKAQNPSKRTILNLTVENDFFFFIDRYYTSGVQIDYTNDFLKKSPINKLLIPHKNAHKNYYSLGISHSMFTPEKTLTPFVVYHDRPYASYILITSKKESFYSEKRLLISSRLSFGLIGSVAGAKQIQNTLHEIIPVAYESKGWHHQIKNDLCIMYGASVEKGLINTPYFELNGKLDILLGVPHTEASIGSNIRFGKFQDFFRGWGFDISNELSLWGYLGGYVNLVQYNATLQGGTFNQDNTHTYYEITPVLLQGSYGAVMQYRHFNIMYGFVVRSPEFENAWWHRWGHIELSYAF